MSGEAVAVSRFGHLSVEEGLSQISVLSIFQDKEGYMWFGTRNGLNKYDGYQIQVFRESVKDDNQISYNHITCIAEDKQGRLWIGTNSGLNRYDAKAGVFVKYYSNSNDAGTLSNNTISCLLLDSDGDFWVGTANGLNMYDYLNDCFLRFDPDSLLRNNRIYALAERDKGDLWMGTGSGLVRYHKESGKTTVYRNDPGNTRSVSGNRIAALYRDSRGDMWVGTYQNGICLFNAEDDGFIRYTRENGLSDNNIRCFTEDRQGNLLIGTFNGLSKYNYHSGLFDRSYGASDSNLPISHYSVHSILCDRAGTVWTGTYSGGVSYYSPYNQRFNFYDPGMNGQVIFGIIGPMVDLPNGLWIGTEGAGLLHLDRNTGNLKYYSLPGAGERTYGRNIIKSIYPKDNKLWIGTTRQSIVRFDTQAQRYDKTIVPTWSNLYYALYFDHQDRLWIGSTGSRSLGYMTPDERFVRPVPLARGEAFSPGNVRCIVEDSVGCFFVGSWNEGLFLYNEHKKSFRQWEYHSGDPNGLPHNSVSSICKTRNGTIWVGTFGGGICRYRPETGDFSVYDDQGGLGNNMVCMIVEDLNGKIWISTSSGISEFDPVTETFTNYGRDNGVGIPEFTPGSGVVTADNEVFFGGNNGFVSFRPEQMQINDYIPPVVITNVLINNKQHVVEKELSLEHNQSNLTIEFSALNYIYPYQNQYKYFLEGFDKDWNEVGNRHVAYYTNIPPGRYVFHVKGSNNDGIWNEDGIHMLIHIAQPMWNTWWAWMLYISFVLGSIIMVVRSARTRTRLENNIRIKQIEQENMENLHQTKIRLFTNFSHELRTPLTLIISPLEDMLQQSNLLPSMRETLGLVFKNANRLLYTVNQLMDFRKKESGHLRLKAAQGNLVKFTGEIVIAFNELARKRRINFLFIYNQPELQLWYDRNLLEKVLFNLLSNAFKNTPDGGDITIEIEIADMPGLRQEYGRYLTRLDQPEYVMIRVSDSGKGIPESELEKIFDPFYQVDQGEASQIFGTGIGLNLSRGVVDLHHGAIWAGNLPDRGAVFQVLLPLGNAHLASVELYSDFKNSEDISHYQVLDDQDPELPDAAQSSDKPDYSVLIVEDNVDVRHYIKSHLKKYYTIYEADNGDVAFRIALDQLPDLVISDIMMPGMDGIELCRMLKNDIRTGHIPVILLTARVTLLQVQEGFETGADEYITKPFNAGLLVTRVKNLIASRERLRELFSQKSVGINLELPTSSVDSRFMETIYDFLDRNMDHPDLDMDMFCKEIGMSRTNLYRKIKAVTNLSPTELIRNTRLKYAARYLKETELSVSEIAYKVGFASPSYFTKAFRAFFHMSPTEMREGKTSQE